MAVPAFLNSTFRYFQRLGVTDVQTIWDDFEAECLANSPPWTRTGGAGGLLTSPVDADGRFFDVQLSVPTSPTVLQMVLRDQSATTVATRRITAPSANGWDVNIYTGQYHFVIDVFMGSAVPEFLTGGILDLTPESQVAHSKYVWANGTRNSSGSAGNQTAAEAFMVDNATAATLSRFTRWSAGLVTPALTRQGSAIFRPQTAWVVPSGGGAMKYAGRAYQLLSVPTVVAVPGAIVTIPIDVATTGLFKVLGGPTASALSQWILCCRIG